MYIRRYGVNDGLEDLKKTRKKGRYLDENDDFSRIFHAPTENFPWGAKRDCL